MPHQQLYLNSNSFSWNGNQNTPIIDDAIYSNADGFGGPGGGNGPNTRVRILDEDLRKDKTYGYILMTTGERITTRTAYDGTVIPSRSYNSSFTPPTTITYANMYSSYYNPVSRQGCFTLGDVPFQFAGRTSGSDAGKGSYRIYVFKKNELKTIWKKLYEMTGNAKFQTFRDVV